MADNRLHFMNAARNVPGTFSCAVDCLLEIWHTVFKEHFAENSQSEVLNILRQVCDLYDQILNQADGSEQDLCHVREIVWTFLRQHCNSFTAMDCSAQFSEIFTQRIFSNLSIFEKNQLISNFAFSALCQNCSQHSEKSVENFVYYITLSDLVNLQVQNHNWFDVINIRNSYCSILCPNCDRSCQSNESNARLSRILCIEMSVDSMNVLHYKEQIHILGQSYSLRAVVRNFSGHFSCAVFENGRLYLFDDLQIRVPTFSNVEELYERNAGGWFFGVYVKGTDTVDISIASNENEIDVTAPQSNPKILDSEKLSRKSYWKKYYQENKEEIKMKQRERYRKRKEGSTSKVDYSQAIHNANAVLVEKVSSHCPKRSKQISQTENELTQDMSPSELDSSQLYGNLPGMFPQSKGLGSQNAKIFAKDKQLKRGDQSTINHDPFSEYCMGVPLHNQKFAVENMRQFHKTFQKMQLHLCQVCHEAWPLKSTKIVHETYQCKRCKMDKKFPKKFSHENNMLPSAVPVELQHLSQCEEILIARAFPIMQVYTKAGGALGYKGHVINLPNDVQHIADVLPHCPKDIPIVVFTIKGKNEFSKEFKVRRKQVSDALRWLVCHNPLYKNVTIDESLLQSLPHDGFLSVTTIDFDDDAEDTLPDTGPPQSDVFDEGYANDSNISSFLPKNNSQKTEAMHIKDGLIDQSNPHVEIGTSPFNEFSTPYLASMAFPTLFPDGIADPTCNLTLREISENETEAFAMKLKHLVKFAEIDNNKRLVYRFAVHPRFAYWSYNMLYRKRLLGQGNFYMKQTRSERLLTIQELREMMDLGNYSEIMNKILHYAKNVSGTNAYWNSNKEKLKALITQKGSPTIFWTLSCAEFHWPEYHQLFNTVDNTNIFHSVRENVLNYPHILDFMFTERVEAFVKQWLYKTLGAEWHWFRYEFAVQRGSIHCHGLAKLQGDPGLCQLSDDALNGFLASNKLLASEGMPETKNENLLQDIRQGKEAERKLCQYHDFLISSCNPINPADFLKPLLHPCKRQFNSISQDEFENDYSELVNTVQRHTKCNSAYCLRENKEGQQKCRFNFPIDTVEKTHLKFEKVHRKNGNETYRPVIVSERNDCRVNRHQRLQLQGWRANCDIQLVIDHHACIEYLAKYASKGEKLSSVVRDAFVNVVSKLSDYSDPKSAIKKLMIQAVGERDMSIQEVMHQILSLKLFSSSFQCITLCLNGSHQLKVVDGELVKEPSIIDQYANRMEVNDSLLDCNLEQFVSQYSVVKGAIVQRKSPVIVRTIPNYSSNANGPNYGKFCKFQLLKYKPWLRSPSEIWNNVQESDDIFANVWHQFLSTDLGKMLVPSWKRQLQCAEEYIILPRAEEEQNPPSLEREEWMYVADFARYNSDLISNNQHQILQMLQESRNSFSSNVIQSMPFWIEQQKSIAEQENMNQVALVDPLLLNEEQKLAYEIITSHTKFQNMKPLLMIITGQAGSGKSYLIDCLRNFLANSCIVCSYLGIAAFNVQGQTLHSLLHLPMRGRHECDLKGSALLKLQSALSSVKYLIIDEFSVIGQKMLGWIDRRCKQGKAVMDQAFGGMSVILVGDIAQLPPIGDAVLYHKKPTGDASLQGFCSYNSFKVVVELKTNQRVNSPEEEIFRTLQIRLRNGESTQEDWEILLSRSVHHFSPAIANRYSMKLAHENRVVAEHNFEKLKQGKHPIVAIAAKHNSNVASSLSAEEFEGLAPLLHLSKGVPVMLTRNLWINKGLCNGSRGIVQHIVYDNNYTANSLPIAVVVKFDSYKGPAFATNLQKCVPIPPLTCQVEKGCQILERQQLPLKLCYAITIHKSQGLTLDKVFIDLGRHEKTTGLSYVAISRVRKLDDLLIEPMSFERLTSIKKNKNLKYRLEEEKRLQYLAISTKNHFTVSEIANNTYAEFL